MVENSELYGNVYVLEFFFPKQNLQLCILTCFRRVAVHRPSAEQHREQHSSEWCDLEKVLSLYTFPCSMALSLAQNRWNILHVQSYCCLWIIAVDVISALCNFAHLGASRRLNLDKFSWKQGAAKQVKEPSCITALGSFIQCTKLLCKIHIQENTVKEAPWHNYLDGSVLLVFLQPYPADTHKWTETPALLCSQVIDNCLNKTKEIQQSLDFQKDSANLHHSYWILVLPSSCSIKSTACSEITAETGNE